MSADDAPLVPPRVGRIKLRVRAVSKGKPSLDLELFSGDKDVWSVSSPALAVGGSGDSLQQALIDFLNNVHAEGKETKDYEEVLTLLQKFSQFKGGPGEKDSTMD